MALWFWITGWFLTGIAVVGNGFVIYLIISRRRLCTSPNWIVLSLALADLLLVICYFPAAFCCNLFFDCNRRARVTVLAIFLYASVMNLCALTIDRYIAIVMPLRYCVAMNSRRVATLISTAWLTSLAVAFAEPIIDNAARSEKVMKIYDIIRLSAMEILPGVSLVVATTRMLLIARKHQRQAAVQISQLLYNKLSGRTICRSTQVPREMSSVPVICFVVSIFVLCYAFNISLSFCMGFDMCNPPVPVRDMLAVLVIINSGANPFAYAFLKNDIKRECKILFRRHLYTFQIGNVLRVAIGKPR